jgi:hypothetical protein
MTQATPIDLYSGDDAIALATEIERALKMLGRGDDRQLMTVLTFFEGELLLIAKALRALPRRRAAARRDKGHGK